MFQIKVVSNDKTSRFLSFPKGIEKVVLTKYNQLVSQGDILDYELV
jgi:hypothetical protein